MREFLRFSFKSREGMPAYIAFFGVSLCGMFGMHLLFLALLKDIGDSGMISLTIYETLAPVFAAAILSITLGRMMRIATNGGTSRRSFLLGTGLICPVFALVSTVMTEIFYLITYFIFSLNGLKPGNIGYEYIWRLNDPDMLLDRRVIILSMTILFTLFMVMYTLSLIYMGVKSRFGGKAGAAAAGLLGFSYFASVNGNDIGIFRPLMWYLEDRSDELYPLFGPGFSEDIPEGTFPGCLMMFICIGAAFYIAAFVIYFLLARRAPVRGKV